MYRKPFWPILYIIGFTLLTLACRSVTGLLSSDEDGVQVPRVVLGDEPLSTFVPLKESVQVGAGETTLLKTHHISRNKLAKVEIFVNNQPLRSEISSAQGVTFSPDVASVRVVIGERQTINPVAASPPNPVVVAGRTVEAVTVNPVEPEFPTSDWMLSLIWESDVPGSYDLSVKATDIEGREGKAVVQRIEVR